MARSDEALLFLRSSDLSSTELAPYSLDAVSRELSASDPEAAREALDALVSGYPTYPESASARLRYAELLKSAGELDRAVQVLLPVAESADEETRGDGLDELSKLLSDLGRHEEAVQALESLYYGIPRHDRASVAGGRLTALRKKLPEVAPAQLYGLALGRAERLMDQRRYREAYEAFESLLTRFPKVADSDLVRLRLGTCQYQRRQISASVANFKRVEREALEPEALYYRAEVERRKRRLDSYRTLVEDLKRRYPTSPWTEKATFGLGRHLQSEDELEQAQSIFERLVETFPQGEHLLDARWQLAWKDFERGDYEAAGASLREATRVRPGADERSRFLYWAGRSFQEAGRLEQADALYRQVLLGYQNTYYGRQASKRLAELGAREKTLGVLTEAREGIDLSDASSSSSAPTGRRASRSCSPPARRKRRSRTRSTRSTAAVTTPRSARWRRGSTPSRVASCRRSSPSGTRFRFTRRRPATCCRVRSGSSSIRCRSGSTSIATLRSGVSILFSSPV